jgi:lipopolysaccharide biosynthesis glycosyltransferase
MADSSQTASGSIKGGTLQLSSCDLGFDKNRSARQALNIVTACDEHYAQQLSVMLLSLVEHNKHYVVNVFVIIPESIHESTLDKIRHSISGFSDNLHFLKTSPNAVENLKVFKGVSYTTYYKLFIGKLLPQSIEKVIYLDCDIVVRGRLDELWNAHHEHYIVGAVTDPFVAAQPHLKSKLGLDPCDPYFNAGVLLIDLNRWRQARIESEALTFAQCHPDRISFADQCPLNWVLRNRWKHLPETWNFRLMEHSKAAKKRAMAAQIIHFAGPSKPWHYMNNHPFKRDYLTYLSRTNWRHYRYSDYTMRNFMLNNAYKLFAPIYENLTDEQRARLRQLCERCFRSFEFWLNFGSGL